jgi:hypothetical protein
LTSRFVRTSRARRRRVAWAGSVRSLVRVRQLLRWAKPCSTGARPTASAADRIEDVRDRLRDPAAARDIIATGTDSYRLAHAKARQQAAASA